MERTEIENEVESVVEVEFEEPPMFKVCLMNDDYTTMEFVVAVLIAVFGKSMKEAEAIMLDVHKNGKGVAGIYYYDLAATKAKITMQKAKSAGFPLRCTLERAE